jgi:hypothetical protein
MDLDDSAFVPVELASNDTLSVIVLERRIKAQDDRITWLERERDELLEYKTTIWQISIGFLAGVVYGVIVGITMKRS